MKPLLLLTLVLAPLASQERVPVQSGFPEDQGIGVVKAGHPLGLCKAQTVQLQDQLRQTQVENAILRAQLAQAVYPQQQEASRKARTEAEKEAGCALDWTQQPPLCKPSPETGK